MSENLMRASREWMNRSDDQRYLTLDELHRAVLSRKRESWTATPACQDLRVLPSGDNDLVVQCYDPTHGEQRELKPSNWSFNQMAQYAGAPAAYMRKLPAQLAAINLQWGLENISQREQSLVLGQSNGDNTLRAMTSISYGRIWDHEVVEAVQRVNQSGRWQVPAASYTTNPKRATTLYASDRDIFLFLVDPKNPVSVGGEDLFRGFYAWNSEVGSAVFGLTTFLYRFVCDNRIIWDATDVKELRIRHTSGAPERFAYEGAKYLQKYAEEGTVKLVQQIKAAQDKDVPLAKDQKLENWLQKRGFTKAQAKASVETANAEQGQARSVWDVIQGVTAYARSIPNTNERVQVETAAGKMMEIVA